MYFLEAVANGCTLASVVILDDLSPASGLNSSASWPNASGLPAGGNASTFTMEPAVDWSASVIALAVEPSESMNETISSWNASAANFSLPILEAQLVRTAEALRLVVSASSILNVASFVPLALVLYDAMIVPLVLHVWQEDAGTLVEIMCALLVAAVVLPVQGLKALLSLKNTMDEASVLMETVRSLTSHPKNPTCRSRVDCPRWPDRAKRRAP